MTSVCNKNGDADSKNNLIRKYLNSNETGSSSHIDDNLSRSAILRNEFANGIHS